MKSKILLVALVSSAAASAAIITETQTKSFSFVPNDTVALTFDKLDTTGIVGFTLNSVTVSATYTKSGGSYSIDNDSAVSGTLNLTHEVVLSLASSDVSLIKTGGFSTSVGQSGSMTIADTLSTSIGATSGDPTDTFNAQPGHVDYVQFLPGTSSISDSGVINSVTTSSFLSTVASTFNINVNALQTVGVTGLGGLQQALTVSDVLGSVTVTYNYTDLTPVPEPSSLLSLGCLVGSGVFLRSRRKN